MRVAVTYDNGNVFVHFGRTEQFKVYDINAVEYFVSYSIEHRASQHLAA